ncbi:type II secretion system protein [Aliiglaciecola sp. CAU 1673]|uniref:pilus assembly FimT family protein n=1 Tax=Aliiglaciecola sp. CAU 1673 TaxID=3032595 RepID=UPI0023DA4035|nr:type II secretion system protein [Aliiglaciecola sp. CAU 1673]MDF2177510.1 type II secretion system protein [Aliiglaciecola sp. CAU 1673]
MHKARGLTLIELLIVMAIISALTMLVGPKGVSVLNSFERFAEKNKVRQQVQNTSFRAMNKQQAYSLHFQGTVMEVWSGAALEQSIDFKQLTFEDAELHFSTTGLLQEQSVAYFIDGAKQFIVFDCELNYVLC